MRSIIMAAVPIHGHVTPLLAVAEYFACRGDRVRFITGPGLADVIEATGAEHLPLPQQADFDDRQDWDSVFPERASRRGARAIAFDLENVFVRPARAQYERSSRHTTRSAPTRCSPTQLWRAQRC